MNEKVAWLETFTTFGALLKHLRIRAQLSQRDLAIAVNYSEAQINRLENNKRAPNRAVVRALFIPALGLEDEPEAAARLLALAESGQLEPAAPRRHNLPRQISSFIGREQEIDQVVGLVWAHPLVTLTGAGGVGKTRLAQAAAGALVDDFSDGVWYVELAALGDPLLVPLALADVLGIHAEPGKTLPDAFLAYLFDREMLLVLDNCEHLAQACAELAQALLSGLARLKIIATSREPLGVNGEVTFYVPSLSLPPRDDSPGIEQSEAARLFIERAQEHRPNYALAEGEAPALARICRQLDGIPLAIELAAARTRLLSVGQIAARLDDIFTVLAGNSRAALPRHRTLRACIDWSYNLLSEPEQALLRRLAIFAGGWDLSAAEQVCSEARQPDHQVWQPDLQQDQILELLGGLVDRSLVFAETTEDGEKRYHILETVRQYAHEKLVAAGEEEDARRRHLACFFSLAENSPPDDAGLEADLRWHRRILDNLDNIRLALDWTLATDCEAGLRLCLNACGGIYLRQTPEFLSWLDRLLATEAAETATQGNRPREPERLVLRGSALNLIIHWRTFWGQQEQAARAALESKAIFEGLGEPGQGYLAETLANLGTTVLVSDPQQSQHYLETCLELLKRHENPYTFTFCLKVLGNLFGYLGDQEKARQFFEDGLRSARAHELWGEEAMLLNMLGWTEMLVGNTARALDLFEQGEAGYARIDVFDHVAGGMYDRSLVAWAQGDDEQVLRLSAEMQTAGEQTGAIAFLINVQDLLARREWARGAYDQAARQAEATQATYRMHYFSFVIGSTSYILGRAALSRGQTVEAGRHFRRLDESADAPRWRWKAYSLHCFGLLAAAQAGRQPGQLGQPEQAERAAVLLGAQAALFEWLPRLFSPAERAEYEQALSVTRAALGEATFAAAWARGAAMSRKEAFALALKNI